MSVELFQEPIRRRYYAPYFSCSYLFFLTTVWILIALPFFLSFDGTFWKKTGTYMEQPSLAFEYKTVLTAYGDNTALTYSSMPNINKLQEDTFRACTVRTRKIDDNLDGLADEFVVTITMPTKVDEKITKIDAGREPHTHMPHARPPHSPPPHRPHTQPPHTAPTHSPPTHV